MNESAVEMRALQSTPFFADLAPEDLEAILHVGRPVSFAEGAMIVQEGDPGTAMYVVTEGAARVEAGGRFHTLGPGDFFGEMALITRKKRMATVKAVEPVRALEIPAEPFEAFLTEHPRVALSMMRALVERLREVEQRLDAWMA